ncbi:glycoside hydrolase family 24 [Thalassoporum mexicanum PCC 7367]|uniref:glycoside hydrolase family 24 protein n=1 Tax=Thalassoporum mexicanum TaxID=3457544 RepID=UPI00029FAFAB|nr:glycoside hydrolase family 104 protein [Pseudanabaena sp. PCC 7367]AFY68788.1 glycoside hydrolase family 24 [Pseudanabaena sp. PCC 7367]
MDKNKLALLVTVCGFIYGSGGLGVTKPAIAQEYNACFMVTGSGRLVQFDFCKHNPPPAPPETAKPASPSPSPSPSPNSYSPSSLNYSASVNLKAFLQIIRYAEGTSSSDGYRIQFTGRRFYNYGDHPRQVNCGYYNGGQLCSTAAGAYQFLETTWDDVASSIGAYDFSPDWQDRGAIELIRRAGAMQDVEMGNIEQAIGKVAPVWASFPRWSGDSYGSYGQSVVPMYVLVHYFEAYRDYFNNEET